LSSFAIAAIVWALIKAVCEKGTGQNAGAVECRDEFAPYQSGSGAK
jgi:hypothetical protein